MEEAGVTEETFDYKKEYATKYEVALVLKGEWKYLLHPQGLSQVEDHAFMISDFETLVGNMIENIKDAPLNDLNEDFEMNLSETFREATLNTSLKAAAGITDVDKTEIGHLTIQELSAYIEVVLPYIPTT